MTEAADAQSCRHIHLHSLLYLHTSLLHLSHSINTIYKIIIHTDARRSCVNIKPPLIHEDLQEDDAGQCILMLVNELKTKMGSVEDGFNVYLGKFE